MITIGIGLFFTLCHITYGFDNAYGHYDGSLDGEFRLLLLGETGHGRRSLGNHLMGEEIFESSSSGQMVTGIIGDTPIIVVNVNGVSDTLFDQTQTVDLIAEAVAFSPQGYDGFLVVLNPTVRITPEEKQTIRLLQALIGDRFFDYIIFVFTHKNSFEERTRGSDYTFEKYLSDLDDEMITFLNKARGRYVFMDTKEKNNHQRKLTNMFILDFLENIRAKNGGERYSNSIFDNLASFYCDYDNGWHQRFRCMYETAKKLIWAFLYVAF